MRMKDVQTGCDRENDSRNAGRTDVHGQNIQPGDSGEIPGKCDELAGVSNK